MPLDDPFLIYQSANNMYAFLVQIYLAAEGIEAIATDHGTVEQRAGQVWISRRDAGSAVQKLKEYLARMHAKADAIEIRAEESMDVVCEECGEVSTFDGSEFGSVQECFHCLNYLDVGEEDDSWWEETQDLETEEE